MTIKECVEFIKNADNFLILSHAKPDGDTLGSGAALCAALRRYGKIAYCGENPETGKKYKHHVVKYDVVADFVPETVVTVDVADKKLLPKMYKETKVDLAIDHHPTNTGFAERLFNKHEYSSCGETVLDVIEALLGDISDEEAKLLYIALSTDTGCFLYMNVNQHSFEAAAKLVKAGADNKNLNQDLFRSQSKARIGLETALLNSTKFYHEGRVVTGQILLEDIERLGATDDDTDDIAGVIGKVEGTMLNITMKQTGKRKCKFSLRSKPPINVAKICAVFDGGGHNLAGGCVIDETPEVAMEKMLKAVDELWILD